MSANTVIALDGVTKRFGPTVALADVTLQVPAGVCFGLIGPNGAGKTTALRCLLGQVRPDSGSVAVLGMDPVRQRPDVFAKTGVLLQHGGMYRRMRVGEAVELFGALYPANVDGDQLLEEFGLAARRDVAFGKLSGGQQTRLLLVLALLGDPELLVLDEPTTGLDPQARMHLWAALDRFRSRGRTVLVTTHYLEEAEQHCDEIALIDGGRILVRGAPPQLLRDRGLAMRVTVPLASVDRPARMVAGDLVSATSVIGDNAVFFTANGATRDLLSRVLSPAAGEVAAMRPANLEDLFLLLTGQEYRDR